MLLFITVIADVVTATATADYSSFSALRKLAFIDNGIKRLSNLNVLGPTLTSLCICDQEIQEIENLNLPNLRELYLHRNLISR